MKENKQETELKLSENQLSAMGCVFTAHSSAQREIFEPGSCNRVRYEALKCNKSGTCEIEAPLW